MDQLFSVAITSLFQAALSTLAILVFGFAVCLGLVSIQSTWYRKLSVVILSLPNFIPVLNVVLSFLLITYWLGFGVLEGLVSVVVVHTIINAGIAGVIMAELFGKGIFGAINLALVEGASRPKIWMAILGASRRNMASLGLGFFALSLSSFSVPLILGGDRPVTLEIFSYRLLIGKGDWQGAFLISVLQLLIFAIVSSKIQPFGRSNQIQSDETLHPNLGFKALNAVGVIGTTTFLLSGFFLVLNDFSTFTWPQIDLFGLAFHSLAMAIGVTLCSGGLYLALGYFYLNRRLRAFTARVGVISTIFFGLVLYLLPVTVFLKITIGLTIVFFPTLFRFLGEGSADLILGQLEVAQIMGASRWQSFKLIVFPQLFPTALQIGGIAGFWAAGDYGLSSIVSGEIFSLAMLAKNLLGGYRLELATVVGLMCLLIGLLVFIFTWGMASVSRQKLLR